MLICGKLLLSYNYNIHWVLVDLLFYISCPYIIHSWDEFFCFFFRFLFFFKIKTFIFFLYSLFNSHRLASRVTWIARKIFLFHEAANRMKKKKNKILKWFEAVSIFAPDIASQKMCRASVDIEWIKIQQQSHTVHTLLNVNKQPKKKKTPKKYIKAPGFFFFFGSNNLFQWFFSLILFTVCFKWNDFTTKILNRFQWVIINYRVHKKKKWRRNRNEWSYQIKSKRRKKNISIESTSLAQFISAVLIVYLFQHRKFLFCFWKL